MRVLLCQGYLGPTSSHAPLVFPLGLSYIASGLKKHDLMCWDPNISPKDCLTQFVHQMETFEPEVIGISLRNIDNPMIRNCSYYPFFVSMISKIKETCPACKLVVGGAGFSIFPEEVMRLNPQIDFGVFSEGEQTFSELLDKIDHPEEVKGLFLRKGDKIVFTGLRPFADFASLPSPSRDFFDISKYSGGAATGIQTKRGCKFNCVYCLHSYYMGSNYRVRNPNQVVDEIETLIDNYNIKNFYFADPVFNYPAEHGREICREIIRRKLDVSWEACFRPDYINKNYLQDALDAGCRLFDFSPDGASDNALRVLGKGHNVACVEKSIELISQQEGIKVAYEFMSSIPQYNSEHVLGLMGLVPKILSQCREKLSYLSIARMRIYPHTTLHKIALKEGKVSKQTNLLQPVYYETKSLHNFEMVVNSMVRVSCIPIHTFSRLKNPKRLKGKT